MNEVPKRSRKDWIFLGFVAIAMLGMIGVAAEITWAKWVAIGGFGVSALIIIVERLHIRHK